VYPKVIAKRVQFLTIKVIKHIEGLYQPTKNKKAKDNERWTMDDERSQPPQQK
jgi:hypothetical protein